MALRLSFLSGLSLLDSFIYLFILAVLGLRCCTGSSLVAGSGGHSPAVACGPLIAVAPLVAEHGLWGPQASVAAQQGLRSCGSWALEHGFNSYAPCGIFLDQGSNTCVSYWQADGFFFFNH